MAEHERIEIGTREQWGKEIPFGISATDLDQHLYVTGKSGTGKTTLLQNLILQSIEQGQGVGVIDPHGDLAEELLDLIPRHRVNDVVYFNPADAEYPIAFNLLRSKHAPHLVVAAIVTAFKDTWGDSWGPRLEYILTATVAALVECNNVSLLSIQRMLADARYRAWVLKQVKDPAVRWIWINEFEEYQRKFFQEAIAPIQNKVGQLAMSPLIRNLLGQVGSTLDIRFLMDRGKIFIANLAKGKLGEPQSNLLGALLVSQFKLAAMSRADIPQKERRRHRLLVDEFQSFTSRSFESILSEARKYRLSLVLSHQYIEQVDPKVREAIFGNAGSLIAFRVGQKDAEVLEREFGKSFPATSFTGLGNHRVLVKLMVNGEHPEPFVGKTLPPRAPSKSLRETIIGHSRRRYARDRQVVENRIRRWLGEYPT